MVKKILVFIVIAFAAILIGCGGNITNRKDQYRENYPDFDQYQFNTEVLINGAKATPASLAQYSIKAGDQVELRPIWSKSDGSIVAAPPNIIYESGATDAVVNKTGPFEFVATNRGETILYLRAHRGDPFG